MDTLIIDVSYLAHRALHSVGDLAHGDQATGVVFGLLRDYLAIQEEFGTTRTVWCFDHPSPKLRLGDCPGYKSSRAKRYKEEDADKKEARKGMRKQLALLYRKYLPQAGYRNVFAAAGFEADDIIARVAKDLPVGEPATIVGSDQDLWQLCRRVPRVSCYNPQSRKLVTVESFMDQWGLQPLDWADVKAIAGCKTDDVPGVDKVGEVLAARYLRGELGDHTKAYQKIEAARDLWTHNLKVVKLPYHGTPKFELRNDDVTPDKWGSVMGALGIAALGTPNGVPNNIKGRRDRRGKGFGL